MLTAADVIDEARDHHPSFTPEEQPQKMCLRFLSRLQRDLVVQATSHHGGVAVTDITIPLPLATFSAGFVLPALLGYRRLWADYPQGRGRVKVTLLAAPCSWQPGFWQAEIKNNVLFLLGTPEEWSAFQSLIFEGTPTPGDVAALQDVLLLADTARSALVTALAAFMARRWRGDRKDVPPPDARLLREEAAIERRLFLEGLWNLSGAEVYQIPRSD